MAKTYKGMTEKEALSKRLVYDDRNHNIGYYEAQLKKQTKKKKKK